MNDLSSLSLLDLVERLRSRERSAAELMEAVLERIDATHADLNAVVALRERDAVLADARSADARIARGEARPLEGVPLGVKDLESVEGMVTSKGSVLFKDAVAPRDEVHVARLRAAGAIPIAKTNAPEFGPTAITKNLLFGVTRNPWNLAHTPGGSSGGSAAALAAGVLPLVTASDGGGSIRIPAAWSGCFGLKPSQGRVPIGPFDFWDTNQMVVYGPLTKTVEDAALFLDQVAGPSPLDPTSLPHPGVSYLAAVRETKLPRLRIGLSIDFGYGVVQSDVASAVEEAARVFEKLGHKVARIEGGPPPLGDDWLALSGWEIASKYHAAIAGNEEKISRYLVELIGEAKTMTPAKWGSIHRQRAKMVAWCAALFERCDLLLTPTTPYTAPPARGPFPLETEGRAQSPTAAAMFTNPFNLSWNPAASVRAGLSRAGLPIGAQIAGPLHRDDLVLVAARAFERERPWHPVWPA
jgi:aspartyl-tRNA(Asn)/glutamyl-tRNA(Gln) amidotransferase subunit A